MLAGERRSRGFLEKLLAIQVDERRASGAQAAPNGPSGPVPCASRALVAPRAAVATACGHLVGYVGIALFQIMFQMRTLSCWGLCGPRNSRVL